jgi:hypothetical protein
VTDTRTRKQKRRDRAEGVAEEGAWWGGCCCLDAFGWVVAAVGVGVWIRRRV